MEDCPWILIQTHQHHYFHVNQTKQLRYSVVEESILPTGYASVVHHPRDQLSEYGLAQFEILVLQINNINGCKGMPIVQPKILSFKMINCTVCKKKNKEQQAKLRASADAFINSSSTRYTSQICQKGIA